LPVH